MQVAQFGGQMAVEFATKGGLLLDAYLATLACLHAKFTINQITPGHGVNFWVRCAQEANQNMFFFIFKEAKK